MKHHHVPAIERALPMERIIGVFEKHFGDPYLNPMAELTFEQLTAAFPDVPVAELEEGLSHWTNHSGEKTLSTKTVEADGIVSIPFRPVLGTSPWVSRAETVPHVILVLFGQLTA